MKERKRERERERESGLGRKVRGPSPVHSSRTIAVEEGCLGLEYYAPTRRPTTALFIKIEVRPPNGRSKAISSVFLVARTAIAADGRNSDSVSYS